MPRTPPQSRPAEPSPAMPPGRKQDIESAWAFSTNLPQGSFTLLRSLALLASEASASSIQTCFKVRLQSKGRTEPKFLTKKVVIIIIQKQVSSDINFYWSRISLLNKIIMNIERPFYRNRYLPTCESPEMMQAEINRLQTQLANQRNILQNKNQILGQIDEAESVYQSNLNQQERRVRQFTTKLDIDTDTINSLQDEIRDLKKKLQDDSLKQLLKEIECLQREIEIKKQQIKLLQGQLKSIHAQNQSIHNDNSNISIKLNNINDQIASLNNSIAHLENQLQALMGNLKGLEKDIRSVEAQICKLKKTIKLTQQENARLRDLLDGPAKNSQINALNAKLADLNIRIEDVRTKIATIDSLSQDLVQDIKNEQFNNEIQVNRGNQLYNQWLDVQNKVAQLQRQLEDKRKGSDSRQKYLKELQKRNKILKCELDVASGVLAQSQGLNSSLKSQVQNYMRSGEEARAILARKAGMRQMLRGTLDKLTATSIELKRHEL